MCQAKGKWSQQCAINLLILSMYLLSIHTLSDRYRYEKTMPDLSEISVWIRNRYINQLHNTKSVINIMGICSRNTGNKKVPKFYLG